MARLYNLARMTTATVGTGTITLATAISGCLTFAAAGAIDGETVAYSISDGANSEEGEGVVGSSGTTLTRTVTTSTNSNSAINLSGSAQVFITPRAQEIGKLTNRRISKSGVSNLANSDAGGTIALSGASSYVFTVNAASSYDSDFMCKVTNETSLVGMKIAVSGYSQLLLFPGQTIELLSQNGAWIISPKQQRWTPPAGFAGLFVDTTGVGNDANDGLASGSGRALATVGAAMLLAQKYFDGQGANSFSINVTGPVTEQIAPVAPWTGYLQCVITGNTLPGQQNAWTLTTNQTAIQARDGIIITVQGFKFSASSTGCVFLNPSQNGTIDYLACEFGTNASGFDIRIDQGGSCNSLDSAGPSSTVTISNASPAVVSWAGHGLTVGKSVYLGTTGSLPTGITAWQIYYIIASGFGANSFQISATPGGAAINTSSAGSGTHTAYNDTGYAITGNMAYHLSLVGPAKHNLGTRIRMPNGTTFTAFVRFFGTGATISWGTTTFVGPGSGSGSVGVLYDGEYLAVFFSSGTTLPGNSTVATTNGALFV